MPGRYSTCSTAGCTRPVAGRKLCGAHYQAAWKRGDFVNAPPPPRAVDRKVCPPDHKHATVSTCYIQHQCRCDPCMDAHSARERRRKKLKAYGRFDRGVVDAAPVREHMLTLGEYGIGYKQAARLAGIGITPARTLIWGRQESGPRNGELQKHVKRETAEALLAIQPVLENLAAAALTPARASVRRLQALMALGWSQQRLAVELGMLGSNLGLLRTRYEGALRRNRASTITVTAGRARAIAALYDRISDAPPSAGTPGQLAAIGRVQRFAARAGWPLPMDWEAYDNDFDRPMAPRRSLPHQLASVS
jgi:hypothetical protein